MEHARDDLTFWGSKQCGLSLAYFSLEATALTITQLSDR